MAQQTDIDWLLERIEKTELPEAIDCIIATIKTDVDSGAAYVASSDAKTVLRNALTNRRAAIDAARTMAARSSPGDHTTTEEQGTNDASSDTKSK